MTSRARSKCCATSSSTSRPGVAETIDWAQSLAMLGTTRLDERVGRRDARDDPEVPRRPRPRARARPRRARASRDGAQCLTRRRPAEAEPASAVAFARGVARRRASRSRSARRSTSRSALDCVGLDRARPACTGRAGRRSCTAPTTSRTYDRAFEVFWERLVGADGADEEPRTRSIVAAFDVECRRRVDDECRPDATQPVAHACAGARSRCCANATSRRTPRPSSSQARRLMADLRLAGCRRGRRAGAGRLALARHARSAPHGPPVAAGRRRSRAARRSTRPARVRGRSCCCST